MFSFNLYYPYQNQDWKKLGVTLYSTPTPILGSKDESSKAFANSGKELIQDLYSLSWPPEICFSSNLLLNIIPIGGTVPLQSFLKFSSVFE